MKGVFVLNLLLSLVVAEDDEPACYLPIDVVFLQDTTGSFVADLPNVVAQIPSMTEQILAQNPDSYWGVAEFRDKPYWPLGENNDFCYKLHSSLQPDIGVFQQAYSWLYASGGGDLPEDQFGGMLNIALDPAVGWRPLRSGNDDTTGTAGARLVILSTDASVHLPGDMSKLGAYPDVPQGLPYHPGNLDSVTLTEACSNYDYPDGYQAKAALDSMDIMVAILTPDDDEKVVSTWKWINEDLLEQPAEFYQFIASDSSDLIEGVLKAIKAFTQYTCLKTTTTTTTEPTSAYEPSTPYAVEPIPTTTHGAVTVTPTVTVTPSMTATPTEWWVCTNCAWGNTTTTTTTRPVTPMASPTETLGSVTPASTQPTVYRTPYHSPQPMPGSVNEYSTEAVEPAQSRPLRTSEEPEQTAAESVSSEKGAHQPCHPEVKIEVNIAPKNLVVEYVFTDDLAFPSDWANQEIEQAPIRMVDGDLIKPTD